MEVDQLSHVKVLERYTRATVRSSLWYLACGHQDLYHFRDTEIKWFKMLILHALNLFAASHSLCPRHLSSTDATVSWLMRWV